VPATHSRNYSILLLIIAAAIITIGIAIKPKQKRPTPISALESARLQRITQERRLSDLGDYIAYAAENAARGLTYVPELQQSAVVIARGTLATAVPLNRAAVQPRFRSRRPDVPVLLMDEPRTATRQPPPPASIETGDWVLAVALRDDGQPVFAYGLYESDSDARCGSFTYKRMRASIPLTSAFLGGGLFSLRGELAGIIARCQSEIVVLSTDSISNALKQPASANELLQDSFGLRVGNGGEVVSVWRNSPADKAQIATGDQIVSVDGEDFSTPDALFARLSAQGSHEVTIRRGRRELKVSLAEKSPPEPAKVDSLGIELIDGRNGVTVKSVDAKGPAAAAGILSGDIVRQLGTTDVASTAAAVDVMARERGPLRVALDRNGSEFQVLVRSE
jgi:hypothetical protein